MKSTESKWVLEQAGHSAEWYAERVEYLRGFMTEERAATLERVLAGRTRYITVCMENTFHPQNASALVRTCEAFGLQEIHTIEEACRFTPNVNIVRGADKWVDIRRHVSTAGAISALRGAGYRIVATTPHRGDRTPESFDVAAGPFALVFGTEHAGISDEVMAAADDFVRIPMYGFVESLNVSASAAILVRNLAERIRCGNTRGGGNAHGDIDIDWQLPESERAELLFRWMMYSVKDSVRILDKKFPIE